MDSAAPGPDSERGAVHVARTSFEESARDIRAVRDEVFGQEQKVARELDWDGGDPLCVHVVATDEAGRPIGTGRIQPDGRIGRMAVLASWRGRGVGRRILEALLEAARLRGLERVHLHAQIQAVSFYERNGFQMEGAEFMEAGIRHVNMTRMIEPPTSGESAGRATPET
jgi:predicted GNAT family N-acyltransferase